MQPEASVERLRAALDEGPLDCVTFTSSSTVTGFLELLDRADPEGGRRRTAATRVACIGPITAGTAEQRGMRVDILPAVYTVPSLAQAIEEYGLDGDRFSAEAWAALVMQFQKGMLNERLLGFDRGHAELLAAIDGWLTALEEGRS